MFSKHTSTWFCWIKMILIWIYFIPSFLSYHWHHMSFGCRLISPLESYNGGPQNRFPAISWFFFSSWRQILTNNKELPNLSNMLIPWVFNWVKEMGDWRLGGLKVKFGLGSVFEVGLILRSSLWGCWRLLRDWGRFFFVEECCRFKVRKGGYFLCLSSSCEEFWV